MPLCGTYVDECRNGESAIFSLRKYIGGSFEKLATIEIDPSSKEILEAQAKYNSVLSKEADEAVKVWKKQAGIKAENYASPIVQEYRPQHNGGNYIQGYERSKKY